MTSERDRFIAELIAALQENEELSSAPPPAPITASSSATQPPTSSASFAKARAPVTIGLSSSAFASDESDEGDASTEDEANANANAESIVFTGFFQQSWTNTRSAAPDTAGGASESLLSAGGRDAREAYEKLQFDFPQIDDAQLLALAESYRQVAQSQAENTQKQMPLPVTNTLIEGVVYLNEKSAPAGQASGASASAPKTTSRGSSEVRGLLAVSVLLLLFEFCLKNAEQIHTRALLGKLQVPLKVQSTREDPDHSVPPMLNSEHHADADSEESEYEEKYAAQEDPDDLSQVYEGEFPVTLQAFPQDNSLQQLVKQHEALFKTGATFAEKLRFVASRTFSSCFTSISTEKWDAWGIDRCLFGIMEQLLQCNGQQPTTSDTTGESLYGHHAQGEWTRYLYILRDRVLRFPNASRSGILKLKDLVELLQPKSVATIQSQWSKAKYDKPAAVEIQLPHHLVYRVLAELVLSKEFQQRSSQPAQRELAAALSSLLPLIIQEIQRLGASRQENAKVATVSMEMKRADESDDLILILIQLVHFLLFASPSKRKAADTLQESGFLRALLTLVPTDPGVARVAMTSKRFWFTPLLRLIAECALWNFEFAEYVARVPKVVALLPAMKHEFPAELALVLVAFYHHKLQDFTAMKALVSDSGLVSDVNGDTTSLWDVFVAKSLFPLSCVTYLDSMKKLQDAVYFLECVVDALGSIRSELLGELRSSLQRIYSKFAQAFVYPTFSITSQEKDSDVASQEMVVAGGDSEGAKEEEQEREERGQAESLQFIALRNKLRQCTKTILLTSSSSVSSSSAPYSSGAAYSSSKLD